MAQEFVHSMKEPPQYGCREYRLGFLDGRSMMSPGALEGGASQVCDEHLNIDIRGHRLLPKRARLLLSCAAASTLYS